MALPRLLDGRRRWLWASIVVLIAIIVGFLARNLVSVVPHLAAGTLPSAVSYDQRYALHPVAAYGHILAGMIFLIGALFQLSHRFRTGHLARHRILGRVVLSAGLVAGVMAIVIGVWFPYGGVTEGTAAAVFGLYFSVALVVAYIKIRSRDVTGHRRFMIRAFTVGLGVATIRLWLIVFIVAGLLHLDTATGTVWFGVAFWLGLALHALAAEVYLAVRPTPRRGGPPRRSYQGSDAG